jgi:hypothetical protein
MAKFVFSLFLFLFLISMPFFGKTTFYTYEFFASGKRTIITYELSKNGQNKWLVKTINERLETHIAHYQSNWVFMGTEYYKDGEMFLKTVYDYHSNKIFVSGSQSEVFDLDSNVLEQNGSFPLLFSRYLPPAGKSLDFRLLQTRYLRLVGMSLREVGCEDLPIMSKSETAIKYEMGVTGRIEAAFWPYKYYYWYRKSDHLFLRYSGMDENVEENIIILKNIKEK